MHLNLFENQRLDKEKKSSVWRWWCWFTQDSFIAFLASDPVGLRPYKQFFRRQKLGSDSIWLRWVGAGWHNSGQTNPRPVRSHPRQGQKNFMIRESLTKLWNSWGFIKNPIFIELSLWPFRCTAAICLWLCIQDFCGRHIMDLHGRKLWICVWPDVLGGWVRWRFNGLEDTRNQLFVWKSKRLPAFWEVRVVNHQ